MPCFVVAPGAGLTGPIRAARKVAPPTGRFMKQGKFLAVPVFCISRGGRWGVGEGGVKTGRRLLQQGKPPRHQLFRPKYYIYIEKR